jgi:hypothetical protein
MAETLASEVKVSLGWLLQDAGALGNVADSSQLSFHHAFANGTDTDQADKVWHDERTLAAGANEDLVLPNLPLSLFDNSLAIALANVKAILLLNTATDDGEDLAVGGATSHEWQGPFAAAGDKLVVPADSCLLLLNKKSGWTVAAGSADKLRIANAGSGDITYRIAILGTSA